MSGSDPSPAPTSGLLGELPVQRLKGVGPRVGERLTRLGIRSVQDLLLHLPTRYQDRTRVLPMAELVAGQEALVEGEIRESSLAQGRRRALRVWLTDGSSASGLVLRFFHFSSQQTAALVPGVRLRCFGEARHGQGGLEMVHPDYRILEAGDEAAESCLTPVYPTTEGLSQSVWRSLIGQALDAFRLCPLPDCLPEQTRQRWSLPGLYETLCLLHRPPPETDVAALCERRHPACVRLAFEELVAHQLSLRRLRAAQRTASAPALAGDGELRRCLRAALPFALTQAQEQALAEIAADLAGEQPMQRLLQGDVGAGKTVVAALAAAQAIESGRQVALMAPTELLSEQHQRTLDRWLTPLGVAPLWLAGRHKGRERAQLLAAIADGTARLVIGTHALFQDEVAFRELGLVVIDEQHRFGVHQRMRLREKAGRAGLVPHQLVMTATPIPRSLAMTLYGDLDLSVIEGLPPGRSPITTAAIPETRRDDLIERVALACREGRQVYWVCTLIEESEALECQAAEETARRLAERLPAARVGLVHGRLDPAGRAETMGAFARGELDLLVATTVIEVGVDVPNASLMIIENPERLGLAQLHQLRGRVGRGSRESHCLLLYRPPLSAQARERLAIIRATTNGFEIAERDLALRGAGEVLGTRQTGAVQFRVADPLRDQSLVAAAQEAADLVLALHPDWVRPLIRRWLGAREVYGQV